MIDKSLNYCLRTWTCFDTSNNISFHFFHSHPLVSCAWNVNKNCEFEITSKSTHSQHNIVVASISIHIDCNQKAINYLSVILWIYSLDYFLIQPQTLNSYQKLEKGWKMLRNSWNWEEKERIMIIFGYFEFWKRWNFHNIPVNREPRHYGLTITKRLS